MDILEENVFKNSNFIIYNVPYFKSNNSYYLTPDTLRNIAIITKKMYYSDTFEYKYENLKNNPIV